MQTNSIITQNHQISTVIASIGQAVQAPFGAGPTTSCRSQDRRLFNSPNLEQRKPKHQSIRRSHKISTNILHVNAVLRKVSFIITEKQIAKSSKTALSSWVNRNCNAKNIELHSILFNSNNQFPGVLEVINVEPM